jgi:hypothetical protein
MAQGSTHLLTRNEYHEYFVSSKGDRYVGLTILSPSCGDCLKIKESQPPGTLIACTGIALLFFNHGHQLIAIYK